MQREAREFVLTHPVVDPVLETIPLDGVSIVIFALAFIGVAFASARKPALGIALLMIALPFAYAHGVAHTTITMGKVALVANAAGLAIGRRPIETLRLPTQRTLILCAIAVLATTALSIVHATYKGAVVRETLKAAEYLATFVVAATAFASDPDERPIRYALLCTTILVSLYAIAELGLGAPSGIWFANVPIPRIAGPLEGPNQLAAYLGLVLALVVAFAVRRPRAPLELGAIAIASVALALTISRSGLIASLAGIAIVLVVRKGPQTRPIAWTIVASVAFGVSFIAFLGYAATHTIAGIDVIGRFSSIAEAQMPGSVGTRSELWHAAYTLWRAHPVFGIGAGNFERELGLAGYPLLRTHANSLFIQALVEGGIPLFAATLALAYVSIARFARGPFADPIVAGTFGATVGLTGHQFFDLLVFYPKVGDQWWLLLALAAVGVDRSQRQSAGNTQETAA